MAFPKEEYRPEETIPFYPHHLISEVMVSYLVLAILIVLASVFPAGLEEPADPFNTPAHVKPEWFFLALYQMLKLVPKIVGVTAPVILGPLLMLLPFLDRNPARQPRRRPLAVLGGILVVIWAIAFTIWGMIS